MCQSSPEQLLKADEGPGLVAVQLSHTKEYLRDLSDDDVLPRPDKQLISSYFLHQQNVLAAKLRVFERKENVESCEKALQSAGEAKESQSSEIRCFAAENALSKAKGDLEIAISQLQTLARDSEDVAGHEQMAKKWRSTRGWEAITPGDLKSAVEAIRHTIEHYGFWQSKESSEKLCYAALHPSDKSLGDARRAENLGAYRRFLVGLLGPKIEQKLLDSGEPSSAIFKRYSDVLESAMKEIIWSGFRMMLDVAEANSSALPSHPIEWAKRQLRILISAEKSSLRGWIMDVCDPPNLSRLSDDEDAIYGGHWRAPRLIHMQPSGNTPYDRAQEWCREGLVQTQDLLEGLTARLTTFLRIELDEVTRSAHVEFAKRSKSRSNTGRVEDQISPLPPVFHAFSSSENQSGEVWRAIHERFRALAHIEATSAPGSLTNCWLRAAVDYEANPAYGKWELNEGVNEYLREFFEVEATRAWTNLGLSRVCSPVDGWLDHVFTVLLEKNSSIISAVSEKRGVILRVFEASAICCARLERLALISEKAKFKGSATGAEILHPPTAETRTPSSSSPVAATHRDKNKGNVVMKVRSPDRFTVLSTAEAALYFEVSPRSIYRWVDSGLLQRGARRGAVTIESVQKLEKKRSRERKSG